MKMPSTIKDISRLAGVSFATVSRALNSTGRMTVETRQKILRIAAELKYSPNISAKGLVTRKSYNIGVLSMKEKVIHGTFNEINEGIQDGVGYDYTLVCRKFETKEELEQILHTREFDGIIFISIFAQDAEHIARLKELGKPLVVINRRMVEADVYNVYAEDRLGAMKACAHLIQLGHTRIAYMDGPADVIAAAERRSGYRSALREAGIESKNDYIIRTNGLPESGYDGMNKLLAMEKSPMAVFAYSDPVAIGVVSAILRQGLRIPQDIAVVAFDNMFQSKYLVPSLTTIDKPRVEMGRKAALIISDILSGAAPERKAFSMDTRMVVRESCGGSAD